MPSGSVGMDLIVSLTSLNKEENDTPKCGGGYGGGYVVVILCDDRYVSHILDNLVGFVPQTNTLFYLIYLIYNLHNT